MAPATILSTPSCYSFFHAQANFVSCLPQPIASSLTTNSPSPAHRLVLVSASASQLSAPQRPEIIDSSVLLVDEAVSNEELWAAACLRIRCFNKFKESYGIEDHKRYLAESEFEALKERIAGKREDLRKVSCINASLPMSHVPSISEDLSNNCKFYVAGEERVVVGTLDLNQCLRLPNEIVGTKPLRVGADLPRAYISNVCVAPELQRIGLGYKLIVRGRSLAEEWGMSDLYVHVAIDNEPAKRLYLKSGFVRESDEPAWQARFLNRTRRTLLWMGLSS